MANVALNDFYAICSCVFFKPGMYEYVPVTITFIYYSGVRCIRGALRNVLQRFPTQRYVSKKRLAALRGIPWSCLSESAFLQRTVA